MEKPIIGVTPLWDEEKKSYWMLPGYLEGVKEAGAIPVILPLTTNGADIAQLADLCDVFSLLVGRMSIPSCTGRPWSPSAASCALPGTLWSRSYSDRLWSGTSPSWASAGVFSS